MTDKATRAVEGIMIGDEVTFIKDEAICEGKVVEVNSGGDETGFFSIKYTDGEGKEVTAMLHITEFKIAGGGEQ